MRQLCIMVIALLLWPAVLLADSDERQAGTITGSAWTNPGNSINNDATRATHQNTDGVDSMYHTNYGFSVPAGATIDTIFVIVDAQGDASQANRRRLDWSLTKNGTSATGESRQNIQFDQNSDNTQNLTGVLTPLYNTTWTVAEINASTFGMIVNNAATQAGNMAVDSIAIRVVWTPAAAGGDTRRRHILLRQGQ